MKVSFRRQAADDLQGIVEWFQAIAPEFVPNILDDNYASIDRLVDYPRSGMRVRGQKFRRIVSRKYHFKIGYEIDGNSIVILGIYRFQNREV